MSSELPNLLAPAGVSVLQVEFGDLEMHRIIGTGQFGLVRIVRHMKTNEVYALKVGTVDHENFPSGVLRRSQGSQLGHASWLSPQALRRVPPASLAVLEAPYLFTCTV